MAGLSTAQKNKAPIEFKSWVVFIALCTEIATFYHIKFVTDDKVFTSYVHYSQSRGFYFPRVILSELFFEIRQKLLSDGQIDFAWQALGHVVLGEFERVSRGLIGLQSPELRFGSVVGHNWVELGHFSWSKIRLHSGSSPGPLSFECVATSRRYSQLARILADSCCSYFGSCHIRNFVAYDPSRTFSNNLLHPFVDFPEPKNTISKNHSFISKKVDFFPRWQNKTILRNPISPDFSFILWPSSRVHNSFDRIMPPIHTKYTKIISRPSFLNKWALILRFALTALALCASTWRLMISGR